MATVKVKFRASSVEGKEGTLYYQVIHQRVQRSIGTRYRLFPHEWDEKAERVVADNSSARRSYLRLIQSKVDWELRRMRRILRHGEEEDTALDSLVREIRSLPPCPSVFSFIERQITRKEAMRRIGTRNNYASTYARFRDFLGGEDLTFCQVDADLMERYEAWLTARGLMRNTIAYYLRTLRTLYHKAVAEGLTPDNHPFAHVRTAGGQTLKRAITVKDIRRMERLELPEGSPLALARDLFLLSFYLRGMAFVDMAFLRKTDLRGGILTYSRRKTNQPLTIEWEKPMQSIVAQYADHTKESPYLLPILTGREADPYARYKQVECRVNANLKKIGTMLGLKIPLTTYVARHTWATTALRLDIPIATISEGMGHHSYKTTQIYLASIDVSAVNQANKKILRQVFANL